MLFSIPIVYPNETTHKNLEHMSHYDTMIILINYNLILNPKFFLTHITISIEQLVNEIDNHSHNPPLFPFPHATQLFFFRPLARCVGFQTYEAEVDWMGRAYKRGWTTASTPSSLPSAWPSVRPHRPRLRRKTLGAPPPLVPFLRDPPLPARCRRPRASRPLPQIGRAHV